MPFGGSVLVFEIIEVAPIRETVLAAPRALDSPVLPKPASLNEIVICVVVTCGLPWVFTTVDHRLSGQLLFGPEDRHTYGRGA